jgi:hypothetical protein
MFKRFDNLVLFCLSTALGCYRLDVVPTREMSPARAAKEVVVLKEHPDRPFEEVAVVVARGYPLSEEQWTADAKRQVAGMGADALWVQDAWVQPGDFWFYYVKCIGIRYLSTDK